MSGQTSEALLSMYDSVRLRPRYWLNFGLLSLITVLEFFDFAIVAFLLAVLGPQWHLTYGQSAIILYSGGVGAICGAVIWGSMADAWGRKLQLVLGYVHLRHRRRIDRTGAARRLDPVGCTAICRGLRSHRSGDPVPHTRRRDHAHTAPYCGFQLLHRVRNRRRAACFGDFGNVAGVAGLARRRHARGRDDPGRPGDRTGGSRIRALAHGERPLCRGAVAGCTAA